MALAGLKAPVFACPQRQTSSLTLVWTLARVLFAADVRSALLAAFLASALLNAWCAWQGFSCFAICFCDDFIAHDDS